MPVESRLAQRDSKPTARSGYVELRDVGTGGKNLRRIAPATDLFERCGPFADRTACAGEIDRRFHQWTFGAGGSLERLASARDCGFVASGAPVADRLDTVALGVHLCRVIDQVVRRRCETDLTEEGVNTHLGVLA